MDKIKKLIIGTNNAGKYKEIFELGDISKTNILESNILDKYDLYQFYQMTINNLR